VPLALPVPAGCWVPLALPVFAGMHWTNVGIQRKSGTVRSALAKPVAHDDDWVALALPVCRHALDRRWVSMETKALRDQHWQSQWHPAPSVCKHWPNQWQTARAHSTNTYQRYTAQAQASSQPGGNPWMNGKSANCCRGGSARYHLALDHFQSMAFWQSFRLTGLLWK
jgi:hypothetical protein